MLRGAHTLHGCIRCSEFYLKDIGMAGLASAWLMARQRLKEYSHKVNAVTLWSRI